MSAATTSVYVDPNTGEVQAGLQQFRNKIINGNFDVWQRGNSISMTTSATNVFSADRFYSYCNGTTGTGTRTLSRQKFTLGQTDVPGNPQSFFRFSQTVQGTGQTYTEVINQRIENVSTLAGLKCTFSFWAKASSACDIFTRALQNFGTGGSPSSQLVLPSSQIISLTTTWKRYNAQFTIPSIAGMVIGTNTNDFLLFWIQTAASTFIIDLSQIQVEEGLTPTTFDFRPISAELGMCMRYYEYITYLDGGVEGPGVQYVTGWYKTHKRVIPSLSAAYLYSEFTLNYVDTFRIKRTNADAAAGGVVSNAEL